MCIAYVGILLDLMSAGYFKPVVSDVATFVVEVVALTNGGGSDNSNGGGGGGSQPSGCGPSQGTLPGDWRACVAGHSRPDAHADAAKAQYGGCW